MSSKQIVMSLIDDTAGKVLDNMHKVLKQYMEKKEADKVLKYIIKSTLKIAILNRNDQFSREELKFLEEYSSKFQTLASTVVSFYEDQSTYDKYFLQNLLEECRLLSQSIVERHLTAKSKRGIDLVFNTFSNTDLLDAIFTNESTKEPMEQVVEGLKQLRKDGLL